MRTRITSGLVVLLGVLLLAQPSAADPVRVIFSRVVIAGAAVNTTLNSQEGIVVDEDVARDADILSATAMAARDLNSGSSVAALASRLTADNRFLSGTGVSAATAVSVVGQSQSHASVGTLLQFLLDATYQFEFTGVFSPTNGSWDASLGRVPFDPDDTPFFSFASTSPGTPHVVGWLLPGLYQFHVGTQTSTFFRGVGSDHGLSPLAFSFRLTPQSEAPVPEPATLLLIGTGVLGIGLRRRRRA